MIINLKNGIDKLIFGMKQKDVEAIYGQPNKKSIDEEGNQIYYYYEKQMQLTFYSDEDFKLGYINTSNPGVTVLDIKVIGENVEKIKDKLPFNSWNIEDFDSFENHFNESNWLILQAEYDQIVRVEIGAIISDKDEFDWKF